MTDRGQTLTLEAFVAAILLLATLTFALQSVSISSDTASGGDAELGQQHVGLAAGVLDQAAENGTLKQTLLYWNASETRFHGADEQDGYYVSRPPPLDDNVTLDGRFTRSLASLFDDRQVRYNIALHYRDTNGTRQTRQLVEFGTPNQKAVRVVETVTLYDNDTVFAESGAPTNQTLADLGGSSEDDSDGFYAPDAAEESRIYNVIRVEVVLWQS